MNASVSQRRRRAVIAAIANLLLLPVHWAYIAEVILRSGAKTSPERVALVVAVVVGCGATWTWVRSRRAGATAQLLLAAPIAIQVVSASGANLSRPRWYDLSDPMFWIALFVLVIVPAGVGAISIIVLRRSRSNYMIEGRPEEQRLPDGRR